MKSSEIPMQNFKSRAKELTKGERVAQMVIQFREQQDRHLPSSLTKHYRMCTDVDKAMCNTMTEEEWVQLLKVQADVIVREADALKTMAPTGRTSQTGELSMISDRASSDISSRDVPLYESRLFYFWPWEIERALRFENRVGETWKEYLKNIYHFLWRSRKEVGHDERQATSVGVATDEAGANGASEEDQPVRVLLFSLLFFSENKGLRCISPHY